MRVTKWGEYGILCSLYIARKQSVGPVGAAEIATTQAIPLQYTQQILQRLRKGNVIKSLRGPKGGYVLARTPELTTLKEILYAAEGNTFEIACDSHPVYAAVCETKICGLRAVWHDLKQVVDQHLEKHTLAGMLVEEDKATRAQRSDLVPGPAHAAASK